MARVYSSGFELQSLTVDGKEWDGFFQIDTGAAPGTISTSIKHSGAASNHVTGNIPANASTNFARGVFQDTHLGTTNKKMWIRAYVLFESFPSDLCSVIAIGDSAIVQNAILAITSGGQLQYYYNADPAGFVAVSPLSAVLNLHQWYRCEISLDTTTATSWTGEFRLDGTTISSFSGINGGGSFECVNVQAIVCPFLSGALITGVDVYYDDIAANDGNGSTQNSWPGAGSIVHLKPNATGDNNQWLKQTGAAADANNFQSVDELTPDDATTYLRRTTSSTPIDDYNVESSASAGIGANDNIKLVQVGCRVGSTSNTITNRTGKLRIKGQSGGTVQEGSVVGWNTTVWATHQVLAAGILGGPYTLTAYTNPQGSVAWTPAALDTMQIGMQAAAASLNEIRCSTLWALVEYNTATNVAIFPTSSLVASTKWLVVALSQFGATSSLILNALEYGVASASLPSTAVVSVDAKVYKPTSAVLPGTTSVLVDIDAILLASAVLPGTINLMVNAKFPNITTAELSLSSTLSFSTKANVAVFATLPGDSSLLLNTKQYFVTAAKLPGDSSLTLNESLSIIARATLPSTSDLSFATIQSYTSYVFNLAAASTWQAATIQLFNAGSFALAVSSSLRVDTIPKFSSSMVLAASSDLRLDTLQKWNSIAILEATSNIQSNASQKLLISSVIPASGSVLATARQNWRSVAILAATSSLDVASAKFVPVTSVVSASSSLTADTRWYAVAVATLAATSSWVAQSVNVFQIVATLPAGSAVLVNTRQYIPVIVVLTATSSLATDIQRYIPALSVWPVGSSLSAGSLRYVPTVAVLANDSSLAVANKVYFAASAVLACSTSWTVITTQTLKHIATAELPMSSAWVANARRFTPADIALPLTSDLNVRAGLLLPMSATLSGVSTLGAGTIPKERNISASLVGATTLLAKAMVLWKAQSDYTLSSDLSLATVQRWNSKSKFDIISSVQVALIQKMFETSKLALTSKFIARPIIFGKAQSNFIMLSTLRANSVVHLIKDHAKTHKHLRGDIERMPLKAGLNEELEEVP